MSNNPFMPNNNAGGAPMPSPAGTTTASDSFSVDLSEVEDSSYAVPDGIYKAKCIDVEQGVSKTGNPMFIWEFEIVEGDFKGRTFKSWTAITPAAMWKVAGTVMALGIGQAGEVVKFKRSDVLGKLCGIVMEQDDYNGKKSSKIKSVVPVAEIGKA